MLQKKKFKSFKGIKSDNPVFFSPWSSCFESWTRDFLSSFHGFSLSSQILGLYHFAPHLLQFTFLSRQVIQHCNLGS